MENNIVVENNKIWCTISHTVNLGNFESYKFEAGYSQSLTDSEAPLDELEKIQNELRLFVLEKAQRVKNGLDAIDELKMKKKRKF